MSGLGLLVNCERRLESFSRCDSVNPIDATILAYIAGFMDGDGSICVDERGQVQIVIYNTYKPTLDWTCSTFGGNVRKKYSAGDMSVGDYETTKDGYEWRLWGKEEQFAFLTSILAYLQEKQSNAMEALEALRGKRQEFLRTKRAGHSRDRKAYR